MRIAYLCPDAGIPVFGNKGASIHVRELTRALQAIGHDVLILAARTGGDPPPGFHVPVRMVASSDERDADMVRSELRRLRYSAVLEREGAAVLRRFRPDVVYERLALFSTAGVNIARTLDVPLIVEVNAPLSEEHAMHRGLALAGVASEAERRTLTAANRVVAVSGPLAGWLVERGVVSDRITIVPNGVDPPSFTAAPGERERVRASFGITDQPVVGFVGTLKPWHDVASLVHAVAALRRAGRHMRLVIVGDGPERSALEAVADTAAVADATTFVGSVPHHEIPAHLAAIDVAIAPYGDDPHFYFSPLKLFEYLAAARPVVAAEVGAIPHCIVDGQTGWLYAAGDSDHLARSIADVLSDRARSERVARAGRAHVLACHRWDENARTVVRLGVDALAAAEAA